jgi:hypothetical protein
VSPQPALTHERADPLPGLIRRLSAEYGDLLPRDAIDGAAVEALEELGGARVREFVPILAWRRARERLRRRSV